MATPPATATVFLPASNEVSTAVLPTPSPSRTPIPMPTLTYKEAVDTLAELMRTNGGCELPCWWSIVPGESSVPELKGRFAQMGLRVGNESIGIHGGYVVSVQVEAQNEVVNAIVVNRDFVTGVDDREAFAEGWQGYSPAAMLERQGHPQQVFVYVPWRGDPGGGPGYHLLLFYDQLGAVFEYRGGVEEVAGRYRACPLSSEFWDIRLTLYQPGEVGIEVEKVLPVGDINHIADPEIVYDVISWEQATGTSLEAFRETFTGPDGDSCFEFSTPTRLDEGTEN